MILGGSLLPFNFVSEMAHVIFVSEREHVMPMAILIAG
jgi:hypothetical protein